MPPELSVVIPVFDEGEVVDELIRCLLSVLDEAVPGNFEILFVDDGSGDDTWSKLQEWHEVDGRIRAVALSRNFGHQAAVSAGLDAAGGEAVVVMDGDMQDDPAAIPKMLELFREGYDVVYAVRVERAERGWKRFGYWLHYRLGSRLADGLLPLDAGDFGLMSRRVVDEVNALPERLRYVRGLRAWVGFRQIGLPVVRGERAAGKSKYTLRGLLRLSLDGLLGFSVTPLRLSIVAGMLVIVAGVGYGAYVVVDRLVTGNPPPGFASLALLTLFLNGTVLVVLGIVGEYVGRIYLEVKRRPTFVVRERLPESQDG